MKEIVMVVWYDGEYNKDRDRMTFIVPDYLTVEEFKEIVKKEVEIGRENDEDYGNNPFELYEHLADKYEWDYKYPKSADWHFDFDNNTDFDVDSYYG